MIRKNYEQRDSRLKGAGVSEYNKPKRTSKHKTKPHAAYRAAKVKG